VSCPSTKLCVAVDLAGDVVTSTDPTGRCLGVEGGDSGRGELPRRCLLPVDEALCSHRRVGHVVTSTNPIGGSSAWKVADADSNIPLNGVFLRLHDALCRRRRRGQCGHLDESDGRCLGLEGDRGGRSERLRHRFLPIHNAVRHRRCGGQPCGSRGTHRAGRLRAVRVGISSHPGVLQGARLGLLYQAAPGGGDSPGRDPNGARCARRRFAAETTSSEEQTRRPSTEMRPLPSTLAEPPHGREGQYVTVLQTDFEGEGGRHDTRWVVPRDGLSGRGCGNGAGVGSLRHLVADVLTDNDKQDWPATPASSRRLRRRRTCRRSHGGIWYRPIASLDPVKYADYPEQLIIPNMCESLFKEVPGQRIAPDLAQSWSEPNPTPYIFDIRKGVKFWDGGHDDVRRRGLQPRA